MLAELIIILFIFSVLVFVYYGIIVPSVRLALRYELFEIRDSVRDLHCVDSKEISSDHFDVIHSFVNNAIKTIPFIDICSFIKMAVDMEKDPSLQKHIKKQLARLDECDSKKFQDLTIRTSKCVKKALIVNSGLSLVYILPFVFLFTCIDTMKKAIKILYASESKFDKATKDVRYA